MLWIISKWRCGRWSKQESSPDAFGTIWHHPRSDVDDQLFQCTGDVWFSFDCAGALMRCQSAEMFWLLLLGSCLLPLLHQMIWKPWPFSHVCNIHTIKPTGCQSQLLPRGKGSTIGRDRGHMLPKHSQIHLQRMWNVLTGFSNAPVGTDGTGHLVQVI